MGFDTLTRNQRLCLRAISDNPADDSLRLLYADACEEAGDDARAEFTRVQVELAVGGWSCGEFMYSCGELWGGVDGMEQYGCGKCRRWAALTRRERELLDNDFCRFGVRIPGFTSEMRRGFVESLGCTCADWLAHGPKVVACQPVTRVELGDRKPVRSGYGWAWWNSDWTQADDPDDLDERLFDALDGFGLCDPDDDKAWKAYVAEQEANNALSRACIAWARAEALEKGLMP